ncbi:MAG: cytochrome c [Polyangiaceae bacterium]|nr:cytochrome c [Polyangiaceae bacterium]
MRIPGGSLLVVALGSLLVGACGSAVTVTAEEYGEQVYFSAELTTNSKRNLYTCSSCHRLGASDRADLILTGADLAGVTERPTYWGGSERDLLRAVNDCRTYFMRAETEWARTEPEAEALYAFLRSKPGDSTARPFTWIDAISNVPRGDAAKGSALYQRACQSCHGTPVSGDGRNSDRTTILPAGFLNEHVDYTKLEQRLVAVEKIRHGRFFGYGGEMPPFAREVLSDEQIGDILESLNILGE